MPGTGIVLFYTPQGFVIGADGLEKTTGGVITSTTTQKLFPLNKALAFAMSGFRSVCSAQGDKKLDFQSLVRITFVEKLRSQGQDFFAFAEAAADSINQQLAKLKAQGRFATYHDEDGAGTISKVFLAGYYAGLAKATLITFSHSNQALRDPQIRRGEIEPGFYAYVGPERVWNQLKLQGDPLFLAYRDAVFDRLLSEFGPNPAEAQTMITRFLQACTDPAVQAKYPECRSIGGRIHVATITSKRGFQWVLRPVCIATIVAQAIRRHAKRIVYRLGRLR